MEDINLKDMCRIAETCTWRNIIVKHFKGDRYLLIDVADHTETGEKMIIYRALYGDCRLYARPLRMFTYRCTEEQFKQYGQEYRFEKLDIQTERG